MRFFFFLFFLSEVFLIRKDNAKLHLLYQSTIQYNCEMHALEDSVEINVTPLQEEVSCSSPGRYGVRVGSRCENAKL